MKNLIVLAVVLFCGSLYAEAAPSKRSIIVAAAPAVAVAAAPAVAVAPATVVRSSVVHTNPTTVTKTEQVQSGNSASYSYSTETKAQPVVTHTAVAAAPAATVVSHTVPAYYYPSAHVWPYSYSYYSPYNYVVGK